MTTRLSRQRAVVTALEQRQLRTAELARLVGIIDATNAAVTHPAAIAEAGLVHLDARTGAERTDLPVGNRETRRRSARTSPRMTASGWRRVGSALGVVVFAGLGSTTLVGSAATAATVNPPANSVIAFGAAPRFGPQTGLALHAGVVGIASDPAVPGYWLTAADGGVFTFGGAGYFGSAAAEPLNAPIVGIAAAPGGSGYWLVGSDGGVFAFGDAGFHGSMAGLRLAAPIVAIVADHSGNGYWLVASDGGVFAFGDARFHGSAASLRLQSPIVAATATRSGHGYWLLGADGGVFSFGDARFAGAHLDASVPAVGIAPARAARGYWIARADGSVSGFEVSPTGPQPTTAATSTDQTVGIAAAAHGGYWLAEGPPPAPAAPSSDPFLACTRAHESDSAGGYHAVSPGGTYRGAYQFDQGTWNGAARAAGRNDLVGVDPATASPPDQDQLALTLFHARGAQPWGGRCAGLA